MAETQRVGSGSPYEAEVGYCRALRVGDRILVSGTAPIADDGSPFAPGDAEAQTRRCLEIAHRAVEAVGGSLAQTVRTRIYLIDGADLEAVARVHGEVFRTVRPVTTAVVVAALVDPAWRVELELELDLRAEPAG